MAAEPIVRRKTSLVSVAIRIIAAVGVEEPQLEQLIDRGAILGIRQSVVR